MTGFALNVYLAQVLYPAPDQKVELALAFTVLNLGFTIPFVFGGPLAGADDRQRLGGPYDDERAEAAAGRRVCHRIKLCVGRHGLAAMRKAANQSPVT